MQQKQTSNYLLNKNDCKAKLNADSVIGSGKPSRAAMAQTTEQVVAIGASTGGTQALEKLLIELPANSPE